MRGLQFGGFRFLEVGIYQANLYSIYLWYQKMIFGRPTLNTLFAVLLQYTVYDVFSCG